MIKPILYIGFASKHQRSPKKDHDIIMKEAWKNQHLNMKSFVDVKKQNIVLNSQSKTHYNYSLCNLC